MAIVLLGQSVPTFWLGMMLVVVFSVQRGLLPVSESGTPQRLILPSISLETFLLALTAWLTRSGTLEVLDHRYIMTARAKGLNERSVVVSHALKNALIPIVAVRGSVMALKQREFVAAAVMTGASGRRVVLGRLAPNVFAPVVVISGFQFAELIIDQALLRM
jgi:ABC-type dipeptide/oligopeptide/nickel transport system permease component